MSAKSKPTHRIILRDKGSKAYSIVGAAWEMEWGMSLVLNPGVVLDWRMTEQYYISVKPIGREERSSFHEEEPLPSKEPVEGARKGW